MERCCRTALLSPPQRCHNDRPPLQLRRKVTLVVLSRETTQQLLVHAAPARSTLGTGQRARRRERVRPSGYNQVGSRLDSTRIDAAERPRYSARARGVLDREATPARARIDHRTALLSRQCLSSIARKEP